MATKSKSATKAKAKTTKAPAKKEKTLPATNKKRSKKEEPGKTPESEPTPEDVALATVEEQLPEAPPKVDPLTPEEKESLRKTATEYKEKIEGAYFEFADVVYKVYETASYLDWEGPVRNKDTGKVEVRKYGTFEEYVDNELGISLRKAHYFVSMVRWFRIDVGDESIIERVKQLGWSKAKELVSVVTTENADEWLKKAQEMTVAQLSEACKASLRSGNTSGDGEQIQVARKTFKFVNDQVEVVTAALEHAATIANSESAGHLLTLICQDYLSSSVRPKDGKTREAYLKRMEMLLNGRIVFVDMQSQAIEYGEDVYSAIKDGKEAPGFLEEESDEDEDEDEDGDEDESDEDESDEDTEE